MFGKKKTPLITNSRVLAYANSMPRGARAGEANSGANAIKGSIVKATPGGTGFQNRADKLKRALEGDF